MDSPFQFNLHDFYRKSNGSYIVVVKEESNPRSVFKISATELVGSRRDLLLKFGLDDTINIIGLANTETPPYVTIRKSPESRYFSL